MAQLPIHLLNSSLITNGNMSGNLTSSSLEIKEARSYSVQSIWSGTPAGTLKLQGSNDNTNWTDIPNLSTTIAGSPGSSLLSDATPGYAYIRVVYTAGSSSGTLNSIINAKR